MSGSNIEVKIFISGHKPCFEIRNGIFEPARQKEIISELEKGTEEDRFMAARANEYCELLTQYWAWKYKSADYYGFGHYRRYFEFADEKLCSRKPALREKYLNERSAKKLGLLDEERIRRIVSQSDVVSSVPFNYYIKSVRWQYENSGTLHVEDLDTVLKIIREEYPEYYDAAREYLNGHYMYTCNIFVMKREIFYAYSAWLFGILRRFYDYRDMKADYERQTIALMDVLARLNAERAVLANGVKSEHPALVAFTKHQNIDQLSRELLVELIDHIKVYENGNISVRFKFSDEFRRIAEYIEINTTKPAVAG